MDLVAPVGRVYHAGTLSRKSNFSQSRIYYKLFKENRDIVYKELENKTKYLITNIQKLADKYSINICINSLGSLFTIFFTDEKS